MANRKQIIPPERITAEPQRTQRRRESLAATNFTNTHESDQPFVPLSSQFLACRDDFPAREFRRVPRFIPQSGGGWESKTLFTSPPYHGLEYKAVAPAPFIFGCGSAAPCPLVLFV